MPGVARRMSQRKRSAETASRTKAAKKEQRFKVASIKKLRGSPLTMNFLGSADKIHSA
jgi:hypothetical protein